MQQDGDLHDYQSGQLGENFLPDNLQLNTERDTHESTGTSILEAGSIRDLNGRTYQGYREGKYFLPNDPIEQDRLDFQHAGLTTLLGDMLSWVPFATSPPHNVLDVATGTGLWAMDFARLYPTANVLGSDLSRIQPEDSKPANCSFVQEDAEEPWLHPKNHFDYIHFRLVTTCFDHPQSVIQQAYESLAPGGWIEFHDAGPLLLGAEGTVAERTWQMAVEGAAAMGRNIEVAQNYKQWLVEAGYVQEYKLPWPMNGWHENPRIKKSGRYMQRVLLDNAQGMVYKMLQGKGLSPSEIEVRVQQCKEEFMDESIHGYWPFYVVYGRKPIY
ncbi:hypothetical protein E8E14_012041 [Neopestalotiopsis sp. 37M]|nr:hypothetical protein E8E14_012041 [Neopestalotiopsis sp. 37M]